MDNKVSLEFGAAIKDRLEKRQWSYRRAAINTGLRYGTIGNMASGLIPGEDHIIRWAEAIGENINYWLQLAGYRPIPEELVCQVTADQVKEQLAEYLIEHKKMTPDEVSQMWQDLGDESSPEESMERKSA